MPQGLLAHGLLLHSAADNLTRQPLQDDALLHKPYLRCAKGRALFRLAGMLGGKTGRARGSQDYGPSFGEESFHRQFTTL